MPSSRNCWVYLLPQLRGVSTIKGIHFRRVSSSREESQCALPSKNWLPSVRHESSPEAGSKEPGNLEPGREGNLEGIQVSGRQRGNSVWKPGVCEDKRWGARAHSSWLHGVMGSRYKGWGRGMVLCPLIRHWVRCHRCNEGNASCRPIHRLQALPPQLLGVWDADSSPPGNYPLPQEGSSCTKFLPPFWRRLLEMAGLPSRVKDQLFYLTRSQS